MESSCLLKIVAYRFTISGLLLKNILQTGSSFVKMEVKTIEMKYYNDCVY